MNAMLIGAGLFTAITITAAFAECVAQTSSCAAMLRSCHACPRAPAADCANGYAQCKADKIWTSYNGHVYHVGKDKPSQSGF